MTVIDELPDSMEMETEIIGQDILEKLISSFGSKSVLTRMNIPSQAILPEHRRNLSIWAEREYGGRTLQEIGHEFCLSTERIRQIHGKYSFKVTQFLQEAA